MRVPICCAIVALALSACSGGSNGNNEAGATSPRPVEKSNVLEFTKDVRGTELTSAAANEQFRKPERLTFTPATTVEVIADRLTLPRAGINMATRIAIMATTTRSSIRVNLLERFVR